MEQNYVTVTLCMHAISTHRWTDRLKTYANKMVA